MNILQKLIPKVNTGWLVLGAAALVAVFGCGYITGNSGWHSGVAFHDMLVNNPRDLCALITPNDKRIRTLADSLAHRETPPLGAAIGRPA